MHKIKKSGRGATLFHTTVAKRESHMNGFVSPDEGEYEIDVLFRLKSRNYDTSSFNCEI